MKKIETYLSNLSKRQKWMVYASVILAILWISYTLSDPIVLKNEQMNVQIQTLQTSVMNNSANRLKKEIMEHEKKKVAIQAELETKQERISTLLASLYRLEFAFFNEKEFAKILDALLQKSLQNHLEMNYVKTLAVEEKAQETLVKHKKRLEAKGSGAYRDIVSLIYYLESLPLLSTFEEIILKTSKNGVDFQIVLDVYGVGL